jgi:nucleotide-binding universal stress UspA family protein
MGLPAWRAGSVAGESRLLTLDVVFSEVSLIQAGPGSGTLGEMPSLPKSLLIATDFSQTAGKARDLGLWLAQKLDAEVHLLHVRELVEAVHLDDGQRAELERLLATGDQRTKEALESDRRSAISVHPHVVHALAPAEAIVAQCRELGCELIVMGTHGRRGIRHLLIGSVAEAVARTAPVPALTVGPGVASPCDGLARILVPFDFSAHSKAALEAAAVWARRFGAVLTLLHVIEPVIMPDFYAFEPVPVDRVDRLDESSRRALEEVAAELVVDNPVETRIIVTSGRAAEAIVSEAIPDRYDLVVMGTRGLGALEHLLLGSVAEGVLRRSQLPLLIVGHRR